MRIYNTMTRRKEELQPQVPGEVRIYACGPTVYGYMHIGNARQLVVFDTLRRYLTWRGYKVTFVQNFTDVDDKMIHQAQEDRITVKELGDRFIQEYKTDAESLGVLPATVHPRATEHIGEIIGLIRKLEKKGLAYKAGDGVYFDTQAYPAYGELSGQNQEDRLAGARIQVDDTKKNPMDFALWKDEKPGEPAWNSPWGKGRPGWHIECSAMSMKYLGETLDIHGGGQDLIFPHHENEIAQSEGATGKPLARYWMHNGFINVNNEKMSKSADNFFTVRDICKQYDPEAVRFFLISSHYRSPVNFSEEQMQQAQAALTRLYNGRDILAYQAIHGPSGEDKAAELLTQSQEAFIRAMDDDMNTADAISVLFDMIRVTNSWVAKDCTRETASSALSGLEELSGVIGMLTRVFVEKLPHEIQVLADARAAARKARNWNESDRLRDEILAKGYSVEDTKDGQKIRLK
ncbi:MAG: cysteine--tRNA ligase [Christensenellales bacterium]|jgi:cysteinyl-tRNA synthetase